MTVTTSTTPAEMTASEFSAIADMLDSEAAIQINEGQEYLVESRLKPVLRQFELSSISELVAGLKKNRALTDATIDAMTTNETLFFRDRHPFDTIRDVLLPDLVAKNGAQPVTIWCAACSSGQEPYSLGMILLDEFPTLVSSNRVRIVATDLSPTMIERCKEGRYSQFEVNRGLPAPLLIKHFDQVGRDWVAKPKLRGLVDFREHNLLGSWSDIPRCDIVLMRNVLIYFTMEVKATLLSNIRRDALKPGGALFLGSSETTINVDDAFEREQRDRSVLYRAP